MHKAVAIFFILIICSCENPHSKKGAISTQLFETNLLLFNVAKSYYQDDSINKDELYDLEMVVRGSNSQNSVSNELLFSEFLDKIERLDEEYYNVQYSGFENKSKKELLDEFVGRPKIEQVVSLNIELNKFLCNFIKGFGLSLTNDEDVFIAVFPEKNKIKTNTRFEADVVIGKRMKNKDGELRLNNKRVLLRDGLAKYVESPNTSKGEEESFERVLSFEYKTNLNGRDTILRLEHTYFIERE